MKKIRILSQHEIQYIAAGEVIENLSSIVKELVENSIDAKASHVQVYFDDKRTLKIEDDGEGIDPEDLDLVFVPHATSKFHSLDNLSLQNQIFFGFRGEALGSIGGVSKITLNSRQKNSKSAYSITCNHGTIGNVELTAGNYGTVIIVSELFENLGARKKYFNSIKQEEKNISYTIRGLSLSHPQVTFSLYKEGKLIAHYTGQENFTEKSKLLIHQAKEYYNPISYYDEYVSIEGLISNSGYGHYDRSRIYILANKRLLKQNNLLQPCIKPYYAENFIKRYPELYLHITVPADQIDVNVHPRKEEILFLYQKKIEQILSQVIESHLEINTKKSLSLDTSHTKINNTVLTTKTTDVVLPTNEDKMISHTLSQKNDTISAASFEKKIVQENNKIIDKTSLENNQKTIEKKNMTQQTPKLDKYHQSTLNLDLQDGLSQKNSSKTNLYSKNISIQTTQLPEKPTINTSEEYSFKYSQFIGILRNTYILLLRENSIIFIDQHALHEKILYENYVISLTKEVDDRQPLLFPEKILCNSDEITFFENNRKVFFSCGIQYIIEGNTIFVTDSPPLFITQGLTEILKKSCTELYQKNDLSLEKKKKYHHS